jgi:hypothetical protein
MEKDTITILVSRPYIYIFIFIYSCIYKQEGKFGREK